MIEHWQVAYRERVDAALEELLPPAEMTPQRLHRAMRYATLGNGKRLRPTLVYLAGEALEAPPRHLHAPACAVELIHCYSLVHDDLPAMDDDDLRRGQPTCHRAFDDATAVLVGDALQSLAFKALATATGLLDAERVAMVEALATAAGCGGMAGGQALDLDAEGKTIDLAHLELTHAHKTGALIRASVQLGALCAGDSSADTHHRLDDYARCIGLAFQVHDDVLDVTGDAAVTGKTQGGDARLSKATYPGLLGLEAAQRLARDLRDEALDCLEVFGQRADRLREIARYVITRNR